MCLFNGLPKASGREVHFTTESFGLVVTQPVLKKWGAVETMLMMKR